MRRRRHSIWPFHVEGHDRSARALPIGCARGAEVCRLASGWFWSSSPNANHPNNAWNVNFNNGNLNNNNKNNANQVCLVRGEK